MRMGLCSHMTWGRRAGKARVTGKGGVVLWNHGGRVIWVLLCQVMV